MMTSFRIWNRVLRNTKDSYNDKYEYIFPDILLDKTLVSDSEFGNIDFQSNLKVHNYDTNKVKKFLINDFDWKSKKYNLASGFQGMAKSACQKCKLWN